MIHEDWITGLLGLLGVVGLLLKEYVMVFLCAVLLLARYGARAWTKWSLANLSYRRELSSKRIWPGERVRMTIEVENDTIIPVPFLECQDEFPEGLIVEKGRVLGHHKPRRRMLYNVLSLRWYERVRRHYSLTGEHRGRYIFGPVDLMAGDLLGFASDARRRETTAVLLIYPQIYELDELPVAWRSPTGPMNVRSWLLEDPTLYGGTRDYTTSDAFNRIEWQASARTQQLKVRVFDASVDQALMIALDLSTHDHPWEGIDVTLLEWSISVAASISSASLAAGHAVGLVTNHYQAPVVNNARGPEQATRILDTLAGIDLYTTWPTPGIVARALSHMRVGETLVAITPRLNDTIVAELRGSALGMQRKFSVIYTGNEPPGEVGEFDFAWLPKGVSGDENGKLG